MSDAYVQINPDSTGKKVDSSELIVSGNTVERQRLVLADDADPSGKAKVQNSTPGANDYGLTVRLAGQPAVSVTPIGLGTLASVPVGTPDGTPLLATVPTGAVGVRFYLNPGDSITYAFASSQPTSAPSPTIAVSNPSGSATQPLVYDENLSSNLNVYVIVASGSPVYRYI